MHGIVDFCIFVVFMGPKSCEEGHFLQFFMIFVKKGPSSQLPGPTTFNCKAFSTYRDKYIVHYLCDENWTDMMKCLNKTEALNVANYTLINV